MRFAFNNSNLTPSIIIETFPDETPIYNKPVWTEHEPNPTNPTNVVLLKAHLKNVYWNSYLDTCGGSDYTACKNEGSFAVSTSKSKTRDGASGTWEIESVNSSNKLIYGDEIYIKNVYSNTYLDTCGGSDYTACKNEGSFAVSTSKSKTRDGKSGTWVIESANGLSGPVSYNDEIYIKNVYSNTYLDTCGGSDYTACKNEGSNAVSTSKSKTRDGKSGTWQIIAISGQEQPSETGASVSPEELLKASINNATVGGSCVLTDAAIAAAGVTNETREQANMICSIKGTGGKDMCNNTIGDNGIQVCEWIDDEGFQNKNSDKISPSIFSINLLFIAIFVVLYLICKFIQTIIK